MTHARPMTPDAFAALHPVLTHYAEAGAHEGIRARGLPPAATLAPHLDMAVPRPSAVEFGHAVPSDNTPLLGPGLARCLDDGLTPEDWLRILNDRVFLWAEEANGAGFLRARLRLGRATERLRFDTARLLTPVWDRAEITPINSGSAIRKPARRGLSTFAPLATLDYDAWRRSRRTKGLDRVREVAVRGGIPEAGAALISVDPV